MNTQENTTDLPAPLALSLDELQLVAAGTGATFASAASLIHIYGGILMPQLSVASIAVRAV